MPGCLYHTLEHNKSGGFLSFIQLVGTCYSNRASSSVCLRVRTWNSYTSIQLRRSLPSNTTEAWNLASENQEGCKREDNKWRRKSSFIHIIMAPLAPIALGESDVAKLALSWSVLFHSTSWTQWMETSLGWNLCNRMGGTAWNTRED